MCYDVQCEKGKQSYLVTCPAQKEKGGAKSCKERCNDPWKWKNNRKLVRSRIRNLKTLDVSNRKILF